MTTRYKSPPQSIASPSRQDFTLSDTPEPSAERTHRMPTLLEALTPVISIMLILGVGYGMLGVRVELLLLAAAAVTGFVAMRLGYSWDEMQQGIIQSVSKAMPAIFIIIVVGALIASWVVSGTIPTIVYYGLKVISPSMFLVTAYLLCSIVSVMTGTSWGTIGTVGVALMGIAEGLGISPAIAAGTIVAGAYFGDKLSPFSDTTNLAPIAAGSNLYDHIGHMLWTTTPAWIIGGIVYLFVGHGTIAGFHPESVGSISESIAKHFYISPILVIPPIITLVAAVTKKPVVPGMLLSIVVALIMAITMQNLGDAEIGAAGTFEKNHHIGVRIAKTLVTGAQPNTGDPALDRILSRGGMQTMMDTTLIALCAFAFAGIAQRARMLEVLLDSVSRVARTTGQLVLTTVASCLAVAFITGNSYLSILIPGELFRGEYKRRGLAAKNLSRTTEDSGTVVVPLIPWSIAGVFISSTLGVSTIHYAPWAIMCYLGMVFAIIYGFTGIGIAKAKRDDETKPGS